jgi:hypothetical protein
MVTLKTSWENVRSKAKVTGRWHDNRHTLITELAESGAGEQTIRDITGHVSPRMIKHYSHIRMEAKRKALESVAKAPSAGPSSKPPSEVVEIAPPVAERTKSPPHNFQWRDACNIAGRARPS